MVAGCETVIAETRAESSAPATEQKRTSRHICNMVHDSKKTKGYSGAVSARGHTLRGRVRQKSHKSAELVRVGSIRCDLLDTVKALNLWQIGYFRTRLRVA